ncbi:uncharacterized protein LOC132210203 [Stegostoma tigrinum]|uniref:uncharacterized protein LOC132210203 n=1 Tax=Stegostoma tigrinum TaxID=3053191 RepID=UPI0028707CAF|nr:uncharacterized protein LOC132210203 [Stegostoma tigrinum]
MDWNVTTMDQNLRTIDGNVTTLDQNLRKIDWDVRTMDQNLRTMDWNVTTMDQNLRTIDWNVTTMDQNMRTIDWNVTTMDQNLRKIDWDVRTMDQNLRTIDWNVTTMDQNLRTIDWNVTTMDQDLTTIDWDVTTMDRSLSSGLYFLTNYRTTLPYRILGLLWVIQAGYYPILAIIGVPVNVVTIYVLLYKDCRLSPYVRRYLGAMAVADLLVIILDLILRHIPTVYLEQFLFLYSIPVYPKLEKKSNVKGVRSAVGLFMSRSANISGTTSIGQNFSVSPKTLFQERSNCVSGDVKTLRCLPRNKKISVPSPELIPMWYKPLRQPEPHTFLPLFLLSGMFYLDNLFSEDFELKGCGTFDEYDVLSLGAEWCQLWQMTVDFFRLSKCTRLLYPL